MEERKWGRKCLRNSKANFSSALVLSSHVLGYKRKMSCLLEQLNDSIFYITDFQILLEKMNNFILYVTDFQIHEDSYHTLLFLFSRLNIHNTSNDPSFFLPGLSILAAIFWIHSNPSMFFLKYGNRNGHSNLVVARPTQHRKELQQSFTYNHN